MQLEVPIKPSELDALPREQVRNMIAQLVTDIHERLYCNQAVRLGGRDGSEAIPATR